jgi:hypothetical protein
VNSFGKFADLVVAYAISFETDAIVNVKVISNNETQSETYYGKLALGTFYDQFASKPLDTLDFTVDTVAGATMSSLGIEIGMKYAREQYAADFDFVIPTGGQLTVNSINYNFDPTNFAVKPFIADVTYGPNDTHVVVYLDATFTYAGIKEGTEPDVDTQLAIKSAASISTQVSNKVKFVSYDSTTRELVLTSKGYDATPIRVTVILRADLTGIESYVVVSTETYYDEENTDYTHALGGAYYVEENLLDKYLNGQTTFTVPMDGIAGATFTSRAVITVIDLIKLFITDQNGGN